MAERTAERAAEHTVKNAIAGGDSESPRQAAMGRPVNRGRCVPSPVGSLMSLLGMSNQEFAAFAGVSVPTVVSYRYGVRHPRIEALYELTVKAAPILRFRPTLDMLVEMARDEAQRTGYPGRKVRRKKDLPR